MANGYPPKNQRLLNVEIAKNYGSKYSDWYDLAIDLYAAGGTYASIAERFTALGVKVSLDTVRLWIKDREIQQAQSAA